MPIKNKLWSCVVLSLFVLIGCKHDDFVEGNPESSGAFQKSGGSGFTICGKSILKFNTLDQVQNTHRNLYTNYHDAGEDEAILIAYEVSKGLYSLRQKERDMDDGIIPDDPTFDTFDYTLDPIFEAMLNEDGMIIIDNYLYLWSDGCVVVRVKPATCKNYKALLELKALVDRGQLQDQELSYYINTVGVEMINVCNDPRYDFESISETGISVDNSHDHGADDRDMSCGFEAVISYEILEHNGDDEIIKLKIDAHSISPIGIDPSYFTYLDNADTFTSVTLKENSLGLGEMPWPANFGYIGEWFVVEIDYSGMDSPIANFRLYGVVSPFSSNGCDDTDTLNLNLACPIGISKKPIDADNGLWEFSVEGIDHLTEPYSIEWTFAGDGGTTILIVYDASGANNTFPTPCQSMNFGVSAFITTTETVCKNQLSSSINSGGYCSRSTLTEKSPRGEKYDGKRVRCAMKVKQQHDIFGGETISKAWFKHRIIGIKSMVHSGGLLQVTGLICNPIDISTVMPPISQPDATKKRLRQRENAGFAFIDLTNPYSVHFSHTNGYSHTLTYSFPCSE